jgi:hypothetical protein
MTGSPPCSLPGTGARDGGSRRSPGGGCQSERCTPYPAVRRVTRRRGGRGDCGERRGRPRGGRPHRPDGGAAPFDKLRTRRPPRRFPHRSPAEAAKRSNAPHAKRRAQRSVAQRMSRAARRSIRGAFGGGHVHDSWLAIPMTRPEPQERQSGSEEGWERRAGKTTRHSTLCNLRFSASNLLRLLCFSSSMDAPTRPQQSRSEQIHDVKERTASRHQDLRPFALNRIRTIAYVLALFKGVPLASSCTLRALQSPV